MPYSQVKKVTSTSLKLRNKIILHKLDDKKIRQFATCQNVFSNFLLIWEICIIAIRRDFVNLDFSIDFCVRLHLNMVYDHFNAYDPHLFPAGLQPLTFSCNSSNNEFTILMTTKQFFLYLLQMRKAILIYPYQHAMQNKVDTKGQNMKMKVIDLGHRLKLIVPLD